MTRSRHLLPLLAAAALLLVVAGPASGQLLEAGTDVWETADGTFADFSTNPIPAGFFCPGSPAFAGLIQFLGTPVVTDPPGIAGNADTVIERLQNIDIGAGETMTEVVVRAMSLVGKTYLDVPCGTVVRRFEVRACTCGIQPITKLTLDYFDESCGCGAFSGELQLNVCITFTDVNTGQVYGPLERPVFLSVEKLDFCLEGDGTLEIPNAYYVGVDCPTLDCADDDRKMIAVPGTSNFFPGRTCDTAGKSCLDLFGDLTRCHSSFGQADHEHCVNPMCCGSEGVPCPR